MWCLNNIKFFHLTEEEQILYDNQFCYEQVTKCVIIKDLCGTVAITIMVKENNKWKQAFEWHVEYWMPIPKLPKEQNYDKRKRNR